MPLSSENVIVPVVLPREFVAELDKLRSPNLRSRSAVVRRIVEEALGYSFSLPASSVDRTESAQADQAV
jgi:metal-responsive CopG/Arc/MetJ family transcriptional regulator